MVPYLPDNLNHIKKLTKRYWEKKLDKRVRLVIENHTQYVENIFIRLRYYQIRFCRNNLHLIIIIGI